jgi:ATP-binding protein involved in chromosome partitioning
VNQKECDKDGGCSSCASEQQCDSQQKEQHTQELLKSRLSHIARKIMVMSGKGGVGKTTVAVNLAVSLANRGYRTGLLDADLHGPNIPKMLGVEGKRLQGSPEGIVPIEVMDNLTVISMAYLLENPDTPVIWRGAMKHGVIRQFLSDVNWGELDYLVVDLPPGTGDEPLSVAQLIGNADGSIIVTTPQDVALLDSRKSVNFSLQLKVPVLGIVENMSGFTCPHCGTQIDLFKTGGGKRAAEEMGVPFLGSIPLDPEVITGGDAGKPFVTDGDSSRAAASFAHIVDGIVGTGNPGPPKKRTKNQKETNTMKHIALASEDERMLDAELSAHFGRCPYYTVATIDGDSVKDVKAVSNPHFNNHQPGVMPQFIKSTGADVIIAGGMGPRAIDLFSELGIEVVTGYAGRVGDILNAYLEGKIAGAAPCEHDHQDGCQE